MSDFAVLVMTPNKTFTFDAVSTFQVSESNQITTHPLPNGELVGDHMIKMPCTISMSGTITMNGSSTVKSLAAIQKEVENVKDNGLKCTVAKCKVDGKEFRFLKRTNMILSGITWTENINTLDYDFTFTQILIGSILETKVKSTKNYLPDLTEPKTLTATGTLISEEELYNRIIKALVDSGVVDKEFLQQVTTATGIMAGGLAVIVSSYLVTAVGAEVATGASISAAASTVAAGGASTGPVGWAIAAGVLLAVGIGYLVYQGIQAANLKYKAFKTSFSSYEEQKSEYKRFNSMMEDIYGQVSKINDWIRCYAFTENVAQEVMVNVGGTYYVFRFTRASSTDSYRVQILDFNEKIIKSGPMTCQKDSSTCSSANAFATFSTDQGKYRVYFLGNSKNLTTSTIVVSSIDITKFADELTDLITSAICK